MIDIRIELAERQAHRFRVTIRVPRAQLPLRLSLPVWIPGSYLVREFARHLSGLQAEAGGRVCRVEAIDKCSWLVHGSGRAALRIDYEVYAFDTSVRTAFLDEHRAFFNASSLCLKVERHEGTPHRLRLARLPAGWQVATAMAPTGRPREYLCADYDELIDHPVAAGALWLGRFELRGVPHTLAVSGAWPGFDGERLLADVRAICDAQMRFWHGRGKPPFDRYVFLLQALEDGYGGLEHRASTALLNARRHLPRVGVAEASDGYVGLLGLVSHEYFHAWNVKRLRPREFERLDLHAENYTRLLWFFEGFTSYYDDLLLLRAGRIDAPRYLQLLGKTIDTVLATPGRRVQSVAEASFDAWIKYYRSDENTPNATVSYYAKGSLVALALDLEIRRAGAGSLDDALRALWQGSGGGPIDEADIERALQAVAGRSLRRELQAWVHGTDELPLPALLAEFGVAWQAQRADLAAEWGLRLSEGPVSGIQVKSMLRAGAAEAAGVCAGDELLAVDGWRVRRLDDARAWLGAGQAVTLLLVRDQRLLERRLTPPVQPPRQVVLRLVERPAAAVQRRRREWLGT
jgi:predicted metalloprotease with PDZ domain